jgi:hypothetical protein
MDIDFRHLSNTQLTDLYHNIFTYVTENRVEELEAIVPDWGELSMSTDELRNEILDEMELRGMGLPD